MPRFQTAPLPKLLFALLAFALLPACRGSRWAMKDGDYAQKYAKHSNKPLKMAKQAADARYVRGKGGYYIGGAGNTSAVGSSGQLGYFRYGEPYAESHLGAEVLINKDFGDLLYLGADAGLRLQSPSRLAPFVGLGAFAGVSPAVLDDDDSTFPPPPQDEPGSLLVGGYPEIGAHFWMKPDTRLTLFTRYLFNSNGHDSGMLLVGGSIAHLNIRKRSRSPEGLHTMPEPAPEAEAPGVGSRSADAAQAAGYRPAPKMAVERLPAVQ